MSRALSVPTAAVLSLLFVAFAACGGDDETTPGEEATPTSATPTSATATQAATAATIGPSFSGSATATVTVGDQTFTFKDGRCDKATDDTWLTVNVGQVNSGDYFGLLVGAHPGAGPDAKPATGGGEFTQGILVTAAQAGNSFTIAPAEGSKITLDADLKAGEFVGTTLDGQTMSGSFKC